MYRRVTSIATSAAVGLGTAMALIPTSAHAAPETYTGHVQVIVDGAIIGCAKENFIVGTTQSTDDALRVSIAPGESQNLTIEGEETRVLGVDQSSASYPINRESAGYTFLTVVEPVPAGSPAVNGRQSAIWSIDPSTMVLTPTFVWPDSSSEVLTTFDFVAEDFLAITNDLPGVKNLFSYATAATFRVGERCAPDVSQAITFTSSAPTSAYPGQTYTVAATGGESGNPVTYSSATTDHCTIDGTTVTFGEPGSCTITANQAAAEGFSAAPEVSQDITVSAIPSTVAVDLADDAVVTGQTTTATADIDVAAGSVGAAGGTVQFAVDGTDVGAPVAIDSDGEAVSPALGAAVGSRQVTGTYTPGDTTNYVGSSSDASLTVGAASTTTKVTVSATGITAKVAPVAPGAGTPTGQVTFRVDGAAVGTADLSDGTAKLAHVVPNDKTRSVSAEYAGDTDFTASSASTSRANPTLAARVTSSSRTRNGWFRKPVRISFTCDAKGSELATACPKPVTVSRQGATSVTRTIHTADGGIATVTAAVKIDRTAPRVGIKGVKPGRSYFDAPKPKCVTKDAVSGVKNCKVTSKRRGSKVVVTTRATDVAGNVRTKRVAYRVTDFTIRGAKVKNGVYQVRHGETYTLVVRGAQARYVYATPAPGKPYRGSVPFKKAGKNTWALGVTMSMTTSSTRSWNLGYTQGGKLKVVKVKVIG